LVPDEDRVFYQEIDLVLTHDRMLTVRKTPPGEQPYDVTAVQKVCDAKAGLETGMIAYHLLDDIAERYLDLLEAFDDEIDELEEHIEERSNLRMRRRLWEVRHDLLHVRRTLAPTRDAVRGVVDGRVDLEGRPIFRHEVFPRDVERRSRRSTTSSYAPPSRSSSHATCSPRRATSTRRRSRTTRTR
jgi:Mg2+ and Co2+ transporter CorA